MAAHHSHKPPGTGIFGQGVIDRVVVQGRSQGVIEGVELLRPGPDASVGSAGVTPGEAVVQLIGGVEVGAIGVEGHIGDARENQAATTTYVGLDSAIESAAQEH
ncbi:MAG: hypothetical protein V9E81_07370 [Marmoricola sp.]